MIVEYQRQGGEGLVSQRAFGKVPEGLFCARQRLDPHRLPGAHHVRRWRGDVQRHVRVSRQVGVASREATDGAERTARCVAQHDRATRRPGEPTQVMKHCGGNIRGRQRAREGFGERLDTGGRVLQHGVALAVALAINRSLQNVHTCA